MTSQIYCFLRFVQHGARFWKCLRDNFELSNEGLEKSLVAAVYKQEKEETKAKVLLYIWKCLNWNKSSKQLIALRKGSKFWKYLLDYSALSKWRPRLKFRGSCLQVWLRRKEEADLESSVGDFENMFLNWHKWNSTVKRYEASLTCFLSVYCIKQIDSKLPCVCSVIDHRRRQNVVRTSVTHSPPLFCSYHILTSSVIYYWTDARQLEIYLLNRLVTSIDTKNVFSLTFVFSTKLIKSVVSLR